MIEKSVVDTTLQFNGVIVLGYEVDNNKKYYFITNTKEVIDYINPESREELTSDNDKFKTLDVKYLTYREFEYNKITDLVMPCVPLFSSPRLSEIDGKPTSDVLENSKLFIEKFKLLDKSFFKDEIDLDIASKLHSFVKANTKNGNMFPSTIDDIDLHILLYDRGIAEHIYNNNKDVVNFLSTGLGVMLEFFEPEVKTKIRELLPNKEEALEFTKNCWRTLLEIYKQRSLELYDEEIKKISENNTLEDFEKEYMLTTTQNEKERIQKLDHEQYLALIDDPNSLIKYWPYTNVNLESTDTIVTNLGGSSVDEKFGDNKPNKEIHVSNDYFFKLINIIKRYIPEVQFSLKDCRGIFNENSLKNDAAITNEHREKIKSIKEALVSSKKAKLVQVKEKMLDSLRKEIQEVTEEEVKKEIQEIITLIEKTQEDIDKLSPQFNTVDILDFWPPALYPMPNELNPNQ